MKRQPMRAILTYHSIDPSGSPISVDEPTFRSQIRWLAAGEVQVAGLEELLALPPGADAVTLTFDDGFANFASRAWPLLREYAVPVTLFVVADHVGRTNAWQGRSPASIPTLPLLDWSALARLAEEGVALGAHSCTHRDLRDLSDEALAEEVDGAAERIRAETGRTPTVFAYPYGTCDERVVAQTARTYRAACAGEMRTLRAREDPHRLPRLDAYYFRSDHQLQSWGSPRLRRRLWLRGRARLLRHLVLGPEPR